MKALASILVLLLLAPVAVAERPPIVVEALKAMSSTEETWSWVQTTVEHGRKTKIERFDPSLPEDEQWTLVESNGRAPTARELGAYRKARANDRRRQEERSAKQGEKKDDFDELIREGSLELIREDLEQVVWRFLLPVKDPDMAEFSHSMKGTLTIGKRHPHWFTIEMGIEKPIKPAPGVHIERMYARLAFRPLSGNGPVMPYETESKFQGRLLLLKRVNEHTVTHYSEYRNVAASP
jgi:hypothetical protein